MPIVSCNICGSTSFADVKKRENARCVSCSSVERTRLMWMYLLDSSLTHRSKVLHLAPERGVYDRLRERLSPGNYVCADIDPPRYDFADNIRAIDLTRLEDEPSDSFDFIIHSHVFEHIPCNIAYSLFHLHRMLKPGGKQICVIPFLPGKFDECFQEMPDKERVRRFGQNDHVRRFGTEDLSSHLGSIVKLPENFDAVKRFGETRLREANIPESIWRGFTTGTVLELDKDDYKLRMTA